MTSKKNCVRRQNGNLLLSSSWEVYLLLPALILNIRRHLSIDNCYYDAVFCQFDADDVLCGRKSVFFSLAFRLIFLFFNNTFCVGSLNLGEERSRKS